MKIIFKQSLTEYVEQMNETHEIDVVIVSHDDLRRLRCEFDNRFPDDQYGYVDDNNNYEYHGNTLTLNGIRYTAQDNVEDFQ